MYLSHIRQAFRKSSILVQRPQLLQAPGTSLCSRLVDSGKEFKDVTMVIDDQIVMSEITPMQTVNLKNWTHYYSVGGVFSEDWRHEDVMVLLEAVRPADLARFLQHEMDVAPVEKVHVLAHGAAIAWHSGVPFGIIMHCSLEQFSTLAMAFAEGALTMDEDLEVSKILTVETKGEAPSLIPQEDAQSEAAVTQLSDRCVGDTKKMSANSARNSASPVRNSNIPARSGLEGQSSSLRRGPFPNQNQNSQSQEIPTIEIDSQLVEDLAHTLTKEQDETVEIWSNESLASNSSVGKALDFAENEALEEENVEEGMGESGSGEALSEMDFDANLSANSEALTQSWGVVRSDSVSKPPNILIYTSKVDSSRNFEKVKEVIEKVVDKDCYVIYHLKVEDVETTPWMDNTTLLVLVKGNKHTAESQAFLRYFQKGGKILGLGSGFDIALLERTEIRPEYWISELTFETFKNVPLIGGRFAYKVEKPAVEDITVTKLGVDSDNNAMIVKVSQKSKRTNGCAILSQFLFHKDAEYLGVNPEVLTKLQQSNEQRYKILAKLLTKLGVECRAQTQLDLTPALLITMKQDLKESFLKSIQNRLVGGMLKFGSQSLKFTTDASEPVKETLLPVLTENQDSLCQNFNLAVYQENLTSKVLGNTVIYADVVPSTMTLLDGLLFSVHKNNGLIAIARQQTSGKGRGGNAWLSPVGCALYTLHVPVLLESTLGGAVSFLQHITSLAVVNSVCGLPGYQDIDLRLKWPNDIYFGREIKLGGVLVKSTVMDGIVHATIGVGLNVSNSNPTICVNDLIQLHNRQQLDSLQPVSVEQIIARTVSEIERLIETFQSEGVECFRQLYYDRWLHSNSQVTLQSEGNISVRVIGLDDYGYLLVESSSGERISVQPDGNSFDMMKNLIAMKSR